MRMRMPLRSPDKLSVKRFESPIHSRIPRIPWKPSAWMNYSGNWGIKSSINKVGIWITWIKHKCKRIGWTDPHPHPWIVRSSLSDWSLCAVAQPHLARHSRASTTEHSDFKLKFCTLQEQEINSATTPHWCMSRLGVRCVYVELSKCKPQ